MKKKVLINEAFFVLSFFLQPLREKSNYTVEDPNNLMAITVKSISQVDPKALKI